MAKEGHSVEEILSTCEQIGKNMGTMGVCLTSCSLPGATGPLFSVGANELELGVGVHGEAGAEKMQVALIIFSKLYK